MSSKRRAALWGAILLPLLVGCPPMMDNRDGNAGKPVGEPNDSFLEAIPVEYNNNNKAKLVGTVESVSDVDVFDLGHLAPGDRLIVDVTAFVNELDASVAIFDDLGRLFAENDDRDLQNNDLDPLIDQHIRWESTTWFLAIAASPFGPSDGAYTIDITVERGGAAPAPIQQVFFLDFDGGSVTIPRDKTYTVGAFDAANIAAEYTGMTNDVKTRIVEVFKDSYLGLDVVVVTSDEGEHLVQDPYSRILFGGFNPTKFGVAEDIDPFNNNPRDVAIVFTNTFKPSLFGGTPTAAELGTAIGNVAAHEAGHLLGLEHTADCTELMDTTCGPDSLLVPQTFKNAPLDDSIFPIGDQDAWLLLSYILGLI